MGNLMVTDFKQAASQAKNGNVYIHENNLYVPFWKIDDQSIQLNSKIFLKINTIPNNIQNNNHIKNNRHNKMNFYHYNENCQIYLLTKI